MVKNIVTALVALALIVGGAWLEQASVQREFTAFDTVLETLYEKTEQHTANKEDVLSVQKWWVKKKDSLHAYLPHNDIKEIDHWLSEAVSLVKTGEYDLALSKIEVLRELCEHIPGTFAIKFENIF